MNYPRIVIAGANSGAGKTTVAMGLILALKKRGLRIQPFKAGPDYIDTSYHSLLSGNICRNLDGWMLSEETVLELFQRKAEEADISLVEGVMGLYDGLADTQQGSTAALAKILRSPVILVVNARSMSASAAALVLGYKEFDKDVCLKGIILNNIGSISHYKSIKNAIEKKVKLPVLGFLPRDKNLVLQERHLGLIPAGEKAPFEDFFGNLTRLVEKNIDIDKIIAISRNVQSLPRFKRNIFTAKSLPARVRIAAARDEAFNFYYQDNFDILRHNGADIVQFSPLRDRVLPRKTDGLYIGGGFPELFALKLSKNMDLKNDILSRARQGMPVYAECGGLMYLVKKFIGKKSFPMAGVFNFSVKMSDRLRVLGYAKIKALRDNILSPKGAGIKAHIFHWSYLERVRGKEKFAYKINKGKDKIFLDGLMKWNVLASYAHIHFGSNAAFAKNFIRSCYEYKKIKKT